MASKIVFVCAVAFCFLQVLEGMQIGQEKLDIKPFEAIQKMVKDLEEKAKEAVQRAEEGIKTVKAIMDDVTQDNGKTVSDLLDATLGNFNQNLPQVNDANDCTATAVQEAVTTAVDAAKATITCSINDFNEVLKPLMDLYNVGSKLVNDAGVIISAAADCFKDVSAWSIVGDLSCFLGKFNSVRDDLTSSIQKLEADLKESGVALKHFRQDIVKCPELKIADAIQKFGKIVQEHAQCVKKSSSA